MLEDMNAYKKEWEEKYPGKKYKLQDAELEESYN
jgi:hypothetical protein